MKLGFIGLNRDALLAALGDAAAGNPHIMTKYPEIEGRSSNRFAIVNPLRYLHAGAEAYRAADCTTPIFDAVARSLAEAVPLGVGAEDIIVARNRYIRRREPTGTGIQRG